MKQRTEVWCQVKGSNNQGGKRWQECQKCCVFCPDKNSCNLRICAPKGREVLCCWQASPSEWMMGRLEEKARMFAYHRRSYEYALKRGRRAGDGTWDGSNLEEFRKKYPEVYQEMLEEIC